MTNIKEQRMHQIYKISNNIVIKSRGKYENLKKAQTDKLGPKDWWKTLKQFIKPTSTSHIPPVSKQGVIYSDNEDKAELMISLENDSKGMGKCENNTVIVKPVLRVHPREGQKVAA